MIHQALVIGGEVFPHGDLFLLCFFVALIRRFPAVVSQAVVLHQGFLFRQRQVRLRLGIERFTWGMSGCIRSGVHDDEALSALSDTAKSPFHVWFPLCSCHVWVVLCVRTQSVRNVYATSVYMSPHQSLRML